MAFEIKSPDHTFKSISGRLGNFMFRTYQDGKIIAYYKPKKKNTPTMDRDWTDNGPIMAELKSITDSLNLIIVKDEGNNKEAI